MKHSERFERAVSALVDAFYKGTLAKWHCCACAVGNICAAGMGIEIPKINPNNMYWNDDIESWADVVRASYGEITIYRDKYNGKAKTVIDSTGYSPEQLGLIEYAFESNTKIRVYDYNEFSDNEITEDQYKGLMAVIDVLCEIEGINSEPTKELFSAKPEICRV